MFQITREVHLGRNIYSDFVVSPELYIFYLSANLMFQIIAFV